MNAATVNSWKNKNRHLFFQFPEEWVAFTPDLGIIEHNADLDLLIDTLKIKGFTFKDFVMKFVHQSEVPIKPVRFASLNRV